MAVALMPFKIPALHQHLQEILVYWDLMPRANKNRVPAAERETVSGSLHPPTLHQGIAGSFLPASSRRVDLGSVTCDCGSLAAVKQAFKLITPFTKYVCHLPWRGMHQGKRAEKHSLPQKPASCWGGTSGLIRFEIIER